MAKIKLPEALKSWKVVSRVSDTDESEIYRLVSKDDDKKEARLSYYEFTGSLYNGEDIDYIKDEVDFVRTIKRLGDISNYIDVVIEDNPEKKRMELFIVTDDSKPLSAVMEEKSFSEDEIIEFGLQMSDILTYLSPRTESSSSARSWTRRRWTMTTSHLSRLKSRRRRTPTSPPTCTRSV